MVRDRVRVRRRLARRCSPSNPLSPTVAARTTYGCSPYHVRLQVLVFQPDTIMCPAATRRMDDYLQYDFVGPPMGGAWWMTSDHDSQWGVGCGGFSLRDRAKSILMSNTPACITPAAGKLEDQQLGASWLGLGLGLGLEDQQLGASWLGLGLGLGLGLEDQQLGASWKHPNPNHTPEPNPNPPTPTQPQPLTRRLLEAHREEVPRRGHRRQEALTLRRREVRRRVRLRPLNPSPLTLTLTKPSANLI